MIRICKPVPRSSVSIDVCRSQILIILSERTSGLTGEICEISFFKNQPFTFRISIIRLPLLTEAYHLPSFWFKCIRKIPDLEWRGARVAGRDREKWRASCKPSTCTGSWGSTKWNEVKWRFLFESRSYCTLSITFCVIVSSVIICISLEHYIMFSEAE